MKLSAEQGYSDAQYDLALMYHNGQGVNQDYKQAVKWYTLVAQQGISNAQYNLALMYSNGLGVTQDQKQAVEWSGTRLQHSKAIVTHNTILL